MTEDVEFDLGFADEHDDWGLKVNPEELNTLNCLNSHLSAEKITIEILEEDSGSLFTL